jgi:hypothetical protein
MDGKATSIPGRITPRLSDDDIHALQVHRTRQGRSKDGQKESNFDADV